VPQKSVKKTTHFASAGATIRRGYDD
jgi:hypothetical protein